MNNEQGGITLGNINRSLGIDKSWINSLQRKTGIPRPIGAKGDRVYFTDKEVAQIETAHILRIMGFSFHEIQELHSLEKEQNPTASSVALLARIYDDIKSRREELIKQLKAFETFHQSI